MSVYTKLAEARKRVAQAQMTKTGRNAHHGFEYFELADFLPGIMALNAEIGICSVVSFGSDLATIAITDTDDGSSVTMSSPMVMAEMAKANPIQALGATHTYMRRYLYMLAYEITEHDAVDAAKQEQTKPAPKAPPRGSLVQMSKAEYLRDAKQYIDRLPDSALGCLRTELGLEYFSDASPDKYSHILSRLKFTVENQDKE